MMYIDVSQWQGVVDWETVKPHIDGAMLRAGYGRGNIDKQFARNAAECNRLGIPCGAYWFSYAYTADMARAEAQALLAAVRPYRIELPLAFDFEYDSVSHAAKQGVAVDRALASAMVRAFCEAVEAGGYWCLNYANPDYLARYFDEDVPRRFGLWLAQWPGGTPDLSEPPRPDCRLWQWTSRGSVPGVAGDVDVSEAYTDFRTIIALEGMNRLEECGASGTPRPTGEDATDDAAAGECGASGSPRPTGEDATPEVDAAPGASPRATGAARPWYADAMAWMRARGLFTEDRPNDTVTRAELAAVVYRLCNDAEQAPRRTI